MTSDILPVNEIIDTQKMTTEKDIRKFMQDNRIPVPKDDRFMADLIRQIDLLPTPASLAGDGDDIRQRNIRLVKQIMEALRRRYRRQACITVLCCITLCIAVIICLYLFAGPDTPSASPVMQLLLTWRYLLLGIATLSILALTLSRTDFLRV